MLKKKESRSYGIRAASEGEVWTLNPPKMVRLIINLYKRSVDLTH